MLCENCHERDATFHLQQNINGKKTQAHLCQSCASEMGYTNGQSSSGIFNMFGGGDGAGSFDINTLWSQLFGIQPQELNKLFQLGNAMGASAYNQTSPHSVACPECGMTMQEFATTALWGCPACYEAFADQMDALLKRVQAGNRHVGRQLNAQPDATQALSERTEEVPEAAGGDGFEGDLPLGETAGNELPTVLEDWQQELQLLQEEQRAAVAAEDYEHAAIIRDQIRALRETYGENHD